MMVEKVKFAGIEYIIMDKFELRGTEYLYIFEDISKKIKGKDIMNLKENINAKADFIFKCSDEKWENVVDDDLYEELFSIVDKRNMSGISQFDVNSGNIDKNKK